MSGRLCFGRAFLNAKNRQDEDMHTIYDCVNSFCSLLDTQYHLVLGRKGVAVELYIRFGEKDCFHLMGLQYLTDMPNLSRDRGKIFHEIREKKITQKQVESSDHYHKIAGRIELLPHLEDLFDSNDTVFKYNARMNAFSMIQADYLMKNRIQDKNVFLFLAKGRETEYYFCRSFFPEGKMDYTKNQASWTLLYKKKTRLSTGEEKVLYDRLNKN